MNLILIGVPIALMVGTLVPLPSMTSFLLSIAVLPLVIFVVVHHARRDLPIRLLTFGIIPLALAALWGSGFTDLQLHHRIAADQQGKDLPVYGCVISDPEVSHLQGGRRSARFTMAVERAGAEALQPAIGIRNIRVSWFGAPETLQQGDCLTAIARLKPPRSFANGLAYDYVASMLFNKIDATGYLKEVSDISRGAITWTARLRQKATSGLPASLTAWVKGLVFGDKSAFDAEQWRLVRDTGTLHLLVVSGLHVGLIAIFVWWISAAWLRVLALIFTRGRGPGNRMSPHWRMLPVVLTLSAAALYVVVAGSGVSLLRAWVMLAAAMLIWRYPRRFRRHVVLLIAATVVLLVNPLSWTQSGFWYSFSAVSALVFFFQGRRVNPLSHLLVPQWVVVIAMIPVMLMWNQATGPAHIIANLLCIPLLTFVILPLSFVAALLPDQPLFYPVSEQIQWLLAESTNGFWWILTTVQGMELPVIQLHGFAVLVILLLGGALWLLGARLWAMPAVVGITYILLLVFPDAGRFSERGLWLIDSGQGQALLVSDGEHSVLIDTGPAFGGSFSVASAAILPLMRQKGISYLDALVVSHSDNDHAGGTDEILRSVPVQDMYTGQPLRGVSGDISCHQDETLRLSKDMSLTFISLDENIRNNDNNHSCIVRIDWMGFRIMVPGDADKLAERALVEHSAVTLEVSASDVLRSDILIAGHHGSRSSTGWIWLNTVAPDMVLFSAGYRNRFGHPHREVIDRLDAAGIPWINTATAGLVTLTPDGTFDTARSGWLPRWHQSQSDERDFSVHGHVLE